MKTPVPRGLLLLWGAALLLLPGLSCQQRKATTSPHSVEKPKAEGDLAFVALTPEEVKARGIATQKIAPRLVLEHLELTGWIQAKQGHEVTITAPVAGYVLELPDPVAMPIPGEHVDEDQLLLHLLPVHSPSKKFSWPC